MEMEEQEHLPPPVPIKTYLWEEVRREKEAGVYPWTHIFKGPYNEQEFAECRMTSFGASVPFSNPSSVKNGTEAPKLVILKKGQFGFDDERDHEYEVINPPAASQPPQPAHPPPPSPPSPPLLRVTDQEGQEKDSEPERVDFRSIFESKHQYLRIPLDRDMVIPIDKAEIESLRYDDEEEEEPNKMHEITAEEIQDHEEARNFAATPATTISKTDGEFNTSQMDSSGLDELPLKREARRGFNARGFQQRISSQAGRLRTRIRNISRPKINLPDRPKFNMPERPKFNIERPKFNLPERPKFNIKRPDLKMPNFNFGKTKSSSIRRPLRDRTQIPSNQSTVGSKKNIFDSINFRTYPRIFNKKKKAAQGRRALTPPPRMETESTPPSTPGSRTGPFNQRWTQRFRDIKFADSDNQSDLKKPSFEDDVEDDSAAFRDPDFKTAVTLERESKQKAESSISIPGSDKEQQSSGSSSERHRAGVIEEIDSDEFFLREKGLSREDVDVSRYLSLEIRDAFRSPKNALASLDREEYDDENEEYDTKLPRSSGEPVRLSMEAIRNQSSEKIRMTPDRDIEYAGDEEVEEDEPVRPERTRSLKKHSARSKSEEFKPDNDNQFNTFPPNRPTRVRKQSSQSKHSIPLEDYDDKENVQEVRPPSIPSLHVTDTSKEMSPRYIDESSEALNEPWVEEPQPPLPPKRRKSTRGSSQDKESLHNFQREQWLDEDAQADDMVLDEMALQRETVQMGLVQNGYYDSPPPPPPMRKSRSQGTSLAEDDRTSRGAESLVSESRTHMTEELEVKPDILPVIIDTPGYAVIEKTVTETKSKPVTEKPKRPPPPSQKRKTAAQLAALKNQSINFFFTYPRRAIKKKLHRTSPPPIRPVRNYSTIGPTRPPRRNRVFREPVYEGEFIPLKDENETQAAKEREKLEYIDNEIVNSVILDSLEHEKLSEKIDQEEIQESRDLQSEDVIEKMKDRPLPPPPRPPRKTKEEELRDEEMRQYTEEEVETTDLDEPDVVVSERIDILVGHPHQERSRDKSPSIPPVEETIERRLEPELEQSHRQSEQQPDEPPVKAERRKKSLSLARKMSTPATPVEATVSTQTDTLPEGFYVEEEQQTSADYSKYEESSSETPKPAKEPEEKKVETIIEHKVVVIPTPETEILKAKKIHVQELDVEKLNVTELQAQKITVSDIDGVSMQVAELSSKSGHLVISGFELPSSFLEAITPPPLPAPVIQIQSSSQTPPEMVDSQTNTTPQQEVPPPLPVPVQPPPPTPVQPPPSPVQPLSQDPGTSPLPAPPSPPRRPSPPPTIVIHSPQGQHVPGYIPSSPPPRSPTRTRPAHDSDEELRMVPRRRRHHSHKHSAQLSTDEEDEEEFPSFPIARRPHQREATAAELIRQLLGIWQASATRGMNQAIEVLNAAFPEGEKRRDAQTAACIVLVLIAGLLILGFGQDRTVHHHHWDFLPPHP